MAARSLRPSSRRSPTRQSSALPPARSSAASINSATVPTCEPSKTSGQPCENYTSKSTERPLTVYSSDRACPCHALMPLSCPHAPVMPSYHYAALPSHSPIRVSPTSYPRYAPHPHYALFPSPSPAHHLRSKQKRHAPV